MGYPTALTIWPSDGPGEKVIHLIDLFFTLADSQDDDAGERMAKEVFTKDGVFSATRGLFRGSNGILSTLN